MHFNNAFFQYLIPSEANHIHLSQFLYLHYLLYIKDSRNIRMLQSSNNFRLCLNLLLMSSLYFAAQKSGYVQKTIQGTPKRITGREIPVHFRVNEFMHNPPKDEEKTIREVDEEAEYVQAQKSTRSLQITLQKGVRSTLVKSAHQLQKPQENTLLELEDGMERSLIKQRQYSSKDTSTSQIDLNRKKLKVNLVESEIGKNQDFEDIFDRSEVERQIQKEKTLRKNLENSYMSLLHKLKTDTKARSYDLKHEKTTNERQSSIFHSNNAKSSSQLKIQRHQRQRKPSQCSEQSHKSSDTQSNRNLNNNYTENLENVYQQQLRRERLFQKILIEQINNANTKIDQLQATLVKRQIQIQKMIQQQSLKKSEPFFSSEQQANHSKKDLNNKGLRHEIHYIFTIFIMFLIIVIVSKQKQE